MRVGCCRCRVWEVAGLGIHWNEVNLWRGYRVRLLWRVWESLLT